jgi:hypothetical protein
MHIQDLVPYLKDKNHHDFGHVINKFQFEADAGTVQDVGTEDLTRSVKKRLGIVNPLDGAVVHPEVCELRVRHDIFGVCHNMLSTVMTPADYMYQCESSYSRRSVDYSDPASSRQTS